MLHVRATKLQQNANAAEQQMMKQADAIRRLEICVRLSEGDEATAKVARQQGVIQQLRIKLKENVRWLPATLPPT
jgi:hypothetical protein